MLSSHQEIILESINNNLAKILEELRSHKHPSDLAAQETISDMHKAMIPTQNIDDRTKRKLEMHKLRTTDQPK